MGTAHVIVNDNDLGVSLTRVNSFGDRGQARITELATGDTWHYSWVFRALIFPPDEEEEDPEFRIAVERANLHRIGG